MDRDPTLDTLLELNGQVMVVDPEGNYWVRFVVRRVEPTNAKPHGLDYALTLHGPDGERLEHDPEKWMPVFGKDHAPPKN